MTILKNIDIDIDKGIFQNIYIDKISYRLGFGISNTPTALTTFFTAIFYIFFKLFFDNFFSSMGGGGFGLPLSNICTATFLPSKKKVNTYSCNLHMHKIIN